MSRRLTRRRLDQLDLRARHARVDPDLHGYAAMSDEELRRTYDASVAAYDATPEAQAHAAWAATLTDDQLVQAFRDGLSARA